MSTAVSKSNARADVAWPEQAHLSDLNFTPGISHPAVERLLDNLPHPQLRLLDGFFGFLLEKEFGHTMLGSKPITSITWLRGEEQSALMEFAIQTLKHNQCYGSHNNFAIFSIIDLNAGTFWLINKHAAQQTIEANLDLFKLHLGGDVSSSELSQGLSAGQDLYHLVRGHTVLEGILYGYGRENSLAVQRCDELHTAGSYEELAELQKKLAWYDKDKWYPDIQTLISSVRPTQGQAGSPCFMAKPDSIETSELVFTIGNIRQSVQQLIDDPFRLRYCLEKLLS